MNGKSLYLIPFQDKFLIYRPLRGLLFLGNRAMADLAQRYCDTGIGLFLPMRKMF